MSPAMVMSSGMIQVILARDCAGRAAAGAGVRVLADIGAVALPRLPCLFRAGSVGRLMRLLSRSTRRRSRACDQYLREFCKLGSVDIGDGPERHAAARPMHHVVAVARSHCR